MLKENYLLLEKLANMLIKEKFEFEKIDINEYDKVSFTITLKGGGK